MEQIKTDGKVVISTQLDNSGLKTGLKGIPSALSGIKSSLAGIVGLLATAFSVTALINFGKEAIELGSDLAEVQNVVDVTFGSMSSKVNQFAKDAMTSYGLSEKVAKQYMGTFGAMSKSFGYTTDAAYEQAAALTALTGDVASFYNLSTDEAYTKLTSVFTGETESLKELGVVMTQTALDEFAMQKGMGKTTSQMSEQEKVALRLAFVTEKLSDASGDFSRTSGGWANQTRVLSLQLESVKATLGQGFINLLTPLLKTVNELLPKIQMLAQKFKEFTQLVFGDAGSTTDAAAVAADSAGAITSNIDSATDSAKELKKQLAGFDKLNVLGSDSGNSNALSAATDVSSNKVADMGESVLGMTMKEADELKGKLEDILTLVLSIASGLLTWKLTHNIGLSFTVAGIALEIDGIRKALQDGLGKINFAEIVAGGGLTIAGSAILGAKIAKWIAETFKGSAVTKALANAAKNLGFKSASAAGGALGAGFAAIIAGLPMYFVGIYDAVSNGLNGLNATLIPIGSTLAGAGIGMILGGPVGAGIGALIGLAAGALTDISLLVYENWDSISTWINSNIIEPMKTFFKPLTDACSEAWTWLDENLFTPLSNAFNGVKTHATQKFTEIKDGVVLAFSAVWSKVVEIASKIKEILIALWGAFKEHVWNPLKEKVVNFYNEYISPIVTKIKGFAKTIWNFIKTNVIDKISKAISGIIENCKNVGIYVVDFISGLLKTVINGVLSLIEGTINMFIRMLNGAIGIINKIPGVKITTVKELQIPRLAQGAVIPANREFLAVLGDQKNGRNLELPENLLRQVVREESGGNRSGTPFIIQLILNGKVIGEEAVEYVNGVIRKTGKSPIKQGG